MDPSGNHVERAVLDYLRDELLRSRDVALPGEEEDLFSSGLIDSLNVMRLVVFVGQAFEIVVGPGDMMPDNFRSIRAIGSFVRRKQSESANA